LAEFHNLAKFGRIPWLSRTWQNIAGRTWQNMAGRIWQNIVAGRTWQNTAKYGNVAGASTVTA